MVSFSDPPSDVKTVKMRTVVGFPHSASGFGLTIVLGGGVCVKYF